MVAIGEMVDEGGKQVERNPDKLDKNHFFFLCCGWVVGLKNLPGTRDIKTQD